MLIYLILFYYIKLNKMEDWCFYKKFYLDLQMQNMNEEQLNHHYYAYGKQEGRIASEKEFYTMYPTFNVNVYSILNPDLSIFNGDKYLLMNHFHTYGNKEGKLSSETDFYNKYPYLFSKYLLGLENANNELAYEIMKTGNFQDTTILTHIHCYNMDSFLEMFGDYIDNLCDFSSIIITYSMGTISEIIHNKNILFLKVPNRGMDIGGKLCLLDYINKQKIHYEYIFFIHSKTNHSLRNKYLLPFIKNKQRLRLIKTLLTINNNNLLGIFNNFIHYYDEVYLNNTKNTDIYNTFKYNIQYTNELLQFMNINIFVQNDEFNEGNMCILHRNVLEYIFKDNIKLFYNILNHENSFDYNWVKINYHLNTNLIDTYNYYKENNLYGNVLECKNNIRDGMIEHIFERIWIKVIKFLNGKFLVLNKNNIIDTFHIQLNAIYFPQFHEIPENNQFWGDGFTEWTLLKPFPNNLCINNRIHDVYKPHESIGYYDLSTIDVLKNQIQIAEKYNINGFIVYHYWFENNKKVLYKPLEYFLRDDIHFPFCISWANETWSRRWDGTNNEILLQQSYGNENDYLTHINYLIPFFQKKNYIRNAKGECIFYIYKFNEIKDIYTNMMTIWNSELEKYSLKIEVVITEISNVQNHNSNDFHLNNFIFEPIYSVNYGECIGNVLDENNYLPSIKFENFDFEYYLKHSIDVLEKFGNDFNRIYDHFIEHGFKENRKYMLKQEINFFSVDYIKIINNYKNLKYNLTNKHLGFPLYWNNKVRRKNLPFLYVENANKDNFEYLFYIFICRIVLKYCNCKIEDFKYKEKNFININAWNEWNEQAILEPNNINGYETLELFYNIINNL
jgi:hypothetical protein